MAKKQPTGPPKKGQLRRPSFTEALRTSTAALGAGLVQGMGEVVTIPADIISAPARALKSGWNEFQRVVNSPEDMTGAQRIGHVMKESVTGAMQMPRTEQMQRTGDTLERELNHMMGISDPENIINDVGTMSNRLAGNVIAPGWGEAAAIGKVKGPPKWTPRKAELGPENPYVERSDLDLHDLIFDLESQDVSMDMFRRELEPLAREWNARGLPTGPGYQNDPIIRGYGDAYPDTTRFYVDEVEGRMPQPQPQLQFPEGTRPAPYIAPPGRNVPLPDNVTTLTTQQLERLWYSDIDPADAGRLLNEVTMRAHEGDEGARALLGQDHRPPGLDEDPFENLDWEAMDAAREEEIMTERRQRAESLQSNPPIPPAVVRRWTDRELHSQLVTAIHNDQFADAGDAGFDDTLMRQLQLNAEWRRRGLPVENFNMDELGEPSPDFYSYDKFQKQTPNPPGQDDWYKDNLLLAVERMKNPKFGTQEFLSQLSKTGGALKEAEEIGLAELLSQRKSWTKDELTEFIDQHRPKIGEAVYKDRYSHLTPEQDRAFMERARNIPDTAEGDAELAALEREFNIAPADAVTGPPQYTFAVSRGPHTEYTENILTMPAREGEQYAFAGHFKDQNLKGLHRIAHVRSTVRTLPDGRRIKFGEEFQSDPHQYAAGSPKRGIPGKGYTNPREVARLEQERAELERLNLEARRARSPLVAQMIHSKGHLPNSFPAVKEAPYIDPLTPSSADRNSLFRDYVEMEREGQLLDDRMEQLRDAFGTEEEIKILQPGAEEEIKTLRDEIIKHSVNRFRLRGMLGGPTHVSSAPVTDPLTFSSADQNSHFRDLLEAYQDEQRIKDTIDATQRNLNDTSQALLKARTGVPNLPLKGDAWTRALIRRLMTDAAMRDDIDGVGWTVGKHNYNYHAGAPNAEGLEYFYDEKTKNIVNDDLKKFGAGTQVTTDYLSTPESARDINDRFLESHFGIPPINSEPVPFHYFPMTPQLREYIRKNKLPLWMFAPGVLGLTATATSDDATGPPDGEFD